MCLGDRGRSHLLDIPLEDEEVTGAHEEAKPTEMLVIRILGDLAILEPVGADTARADLPREA